MSDISVEGGDISAQQVRVIDFMLKEKRWYSVREIASGAQVSERTGQNLARKFVRLGIFEQADLHPAPRYRLSEGAANKSGAFFDKIAAARRAFNLEDAR